MRLAALAIAAMLPTSAFATLTVSFQDGAPKDRFTLQYDGGCILDAVDVQIDLGTAPAGLIFDITAAGAGVEVFQPLEWVVGTATTSEVTDGDTALSLTLAQLVPGEARVFTIDLDDTTSARQITVDGSEMAGATLSVDGQSMQFGTDGRATIALPACTS